MQCKDYVKWGFKDDKWSLSLIRKCWERAISVETEDICCVTEIDWGNGWCNRCI